MGTSRSSGATASSPKEPRGAEPITASPTANRVTPVADRHHVAGEVAADGGGMARSPEAEGEPGEQREPGQHVEGPAVDRGGPDGHEDLALARVRHRQLREGQHLGAP